MNISICIVYFLLLPSACIPGQDNEKLLKEIDNRLTKGQTTISDILSNRIYMFLHSQIPFREIIKKNAKSGKVKIITDTEPGKKITVKGEIKTSKGNPVNDAMVYVYQTSHKGWYADTAAHIEAYEGDMRHARLFGYLKTDRKGQFEFETIQPKGYPGSDFPAHIHIAVWKDERRVSGLPGELQFVDDPRMTPERKSSSVRFGNLVEKNSGTPEKPVYFYTLVLKD